MPPHSLTQQNEITKNEEVKDYPATFVQDKSYRTLWGTFKMPLKWGNIIALTTLHALITYLYIIYDGQQLYFYMYYFIIGFISSFGVTAGAHRLWTHRTLKASKPLRYVLIVLYSMCGHNRLFDWVRDHRVHHKNSETDADPHNSKRGFFFAHMGWLMMKKHPEVIKKGKQLDLSDLWQDPVFCFMEKYYYQMVLFWCFIFPPILPCLLWNESFFWSFMANVTRYLIQLHLAWLINSAAHIYGDRPFDGKIGPTDNRFTSLWGFGESFHNFHHSFPWDYRGSPRGAFNLTANVIDVMHYFGHVTDLKAASPQMIQKYIDNYGDGSHIKSTIYQNL